MQQVQKINQQSNSDPSQPDNNNILWQPSFWLKFMIAYMYFLQGIIISIGSTMPYVYHKLPNYSTLSIFAAITLPFSFKFLTAPFLEKFSNVAYGKRKTWIIISQLMCSLLILIVSFFTQQKYANYFAIILIITLFFITLQDISLDSLALKQLRIPYLVALLQSVAQTAGAILGSLILLKFTSKQFSNKIGLEYEITTANIILKIISLLILLPTILIHIKFKQTILTNELIIMNSSLWQFIKKYIIFFNIRTKYCRTSIFYLFYLQGFNFFNAGYQYQLIKNGFQRDTLNTISNIMIIPIAILVCIFSSKIQKFGLLNSFMVNMIIRQILYIMLLIIFPTQVIVIGFIIFLMSGISNWMFMVTSIINNNFPIAGVSGMYLTMLASTNNFGRQVPIHTKLIGIFGWDNMAWIGLALQMIIIIFMPKIYSWIEAGQLIINDSPLVHNLQQRQLQQHKNS